MDAATVISVISLLVAVVGTALSNMRATEALDESKKASTAILWSGAQEVVQPFIGFDPASQEVGDRLVNFRIAMIALVDGLKDWEGLDLWLDVERALGTALGRQVTERATPQDSIEDRLTLLDPYHAWAQTLSMSLRRFRNQGYDRTAVEKLREQAEGELQRVCKANGWEPPRMGIRGLRPLETE